MTPWDAFVPKIAMRLPGVDRFNAVAKLKYVAREYLTTTWAWRQSNVVLAAVTPGIADYPVTPSVDRVIVGLCAARLDDDEIAVAPLAGEANDWNSTDTANDPRVELVHPELVRLLPAPDRTGMLVAQVALVPSDTAEGLDDDVFRRCQEGIICAALAELLLEPETTYTNPSLASYYEAKAAARRAVDSTRAGPKHREGLRVKPC